MTFWGYPRTKPFPIKPDWLSNKMANNEENMTEKISKHKM